MYLLIENHGSDVDFIEISSETKNRPGKSRPVLFQNLIPRTAVESFYFNLREQVGKLRSALYVPWRHPEGRGAYMLRREAQTRLKRCWLNIIGF